jgi:hypothetical protein
MGELLLGQILAPVDPYMICSGPDSRSPPWRTRPSSQPMNAPASSVNPSLSSA